MDARPEAGLMESWLIPAEPVTFVEEIKKSRFITLLAHTDGVEAAKAFVESVRAEHPDARHHCVAWVAGPPDDSQQLGFSDDGEPAGTAGKPMLSQLMGSGVGEITAVVVRYYGGILLGHGWAGKSVWQRSSAGTEYAHKLSAKRRSLNILCCAITLSYRALKRCSNSLTA
ncbi:IMPACT family member yigZ [Enterobacter asburiae]|uniref:IMPACT family member yigZ n=1 Tax=Enterobacter asburiae TaxID=61645 RepID=A0A376FGS7_ENTAS|nr:IMPACT family member yigZ [Enterobacter asburiae]